MIYLWIPLGVILFLIIIFPFIFCILPSLLLKTDEELFEKKLKQEGLDKKIGGGGEWDIEDIATYHRCLDECTKWRWQHD